MPIGTNPTVLKVGWSLIAILIFVGIFYIFNS